MILNSEELVRLPESQLETLDLALLDLLCAGGLPGSERIDIGRGLRWVDDAARLVSHKTEGHFFQFEEHPERYNHSEGDFRMIWLVTVLQRDLGVHYRQESIELDDHDFFGRPENLFIYGIIQGKGGTCSSLPVMYAAVGRRLGYPLKLATCKKHQFVRWDGPDGQRFNVESTSRGFVSWPDDYYMKWPFETTPEEVQRYGFLRSETAAVVVAGFFARRGHVWMEHGRYADAVAEYLRAYHRAPGRELLVNCLHRAATEWGQHMRAQIGAGFPGLVICNQPRWHRDLPENLQAEMNYLNALEVMLNDPVRKAAWWDPLRRNPNARPTGMPERIKVTYSTVPGGPLVFEPFPRAASG